jgi:hypothetical protein
VRLSDAWKESFERHSMNMAVEELHFQPLLHVADYLVFLIESQIVQGDMAPRTQEAAEILREAIQEQESRWAAEAIKVGAVHD